MKNRYEIQGMVNGQWSWMHVAHIAVKLYDARYESIDEAMSALENLAETTGCDRHCLRVVEIDTGSWVKA
jgi:hypothetical protein